MRKLRVILAICVGMLFFGLLLAYLHPGQVQAAPSSYNESSLAESSLDVTNVISKALAYIATNQQADGGIDGFGLGSDTGSTARAILALAAAGRSIDWMAHITTGRTTLDYLDKNAITYTHDTTGTLFPAQAGLLLAAVSAVDADPMNFGGMDIISELEAAYNPVTGAYSTTASQGYNNGVASDINQGWAIFGLSAAGRPVPVSATNLLINSQAQDGTWSFGSPDATALVVVALIGSGNILPHDTAIQNAIDYFRDTQLSNGGWRSGWDIDPVNADTTAWIMQALASAGYTPVTSSWEKESGNPRVALISLQKPDGSIGGSYVNPYSTIEAIFGLAENPLFFFGSSHRALRALTWMNEIQNSDGSWPDFFAPAGATADAVLAYASAGFDPYTVIASNSFTSAMDYLASQAVPYSASDPASAGKLALAVEAAGGDAHNFNGLDIIGVLTSTHFSPTLGAFGVMTNTWHQAFAIMGLAAAGESVPISATHTLLNLQQPDGGWKYDLGPWSISSDADSTGLALQALIAIGTSPTHTSILSATSFLKAQQDDQGGWGNANSTAYAIQGLLSVGEDLQNEWLVDGQSPLGALANYQKVDGPFVFDWDSPWVIPNDDFFATRQAIPALMNVYYPYTPTSLADFLSFQRGADPDRMVAAAARPTWGNSVDITIPFGSDLDRDGSLSLDWRVLGDTNWITGTAVSRADGYFTATLPITLPFSYEFSATFLDPDGVQAGLIITDSISMISVLMPRQIFLPTITK